jgi:hypothetical protein
MADVDLASVGKRELERPVRVPNEGSLLPDTVFELPLMPRELVLP